MVEGEKQVCLYIAYASPVMNYYYNYVECNIIVGALSYFSPLSIKTEIKCIKKVYTLI